MPSARVAPMPQGCHGLQVVAWGGERPKGVVTLCGSTKFREEFEAEMARLTLDGNIVISVGLFGHALNMQCKVCGEPKEWHGNLPPLEGAHDYETSFDFGTDDAPSSLKLALDNLHFRKIDLADYIHVINKDGYVGTSTAREVFYATEHGTGVSWMEPLTASEQEEVLRKGEAAWQQHLVQMGEMA